MTSLGQYANGRTIECELLKASKIEAEIDITELNTQSVSLEDKWKIYLDANDSFIIKNEIQNVISLTADGLTGDVTLHGSGGGGAENLTDLQDVCATALNGQMFYYNATASKYEFTNNIINDEANSRITIPNLNVHNISPHICAATQLVSAPILAGSTGSFSTRLTSQEISANEISCNILNYNTLNPPISISTNLTDLQDVNATALNGDMFFYNATTGKYEFTSNIKNDETNSRIIINDLSANEISCNILNYNTLNPPISISTNLTDLTDVCGTALAGDMFFYNATSGKYEFTNNIENDIANDVIIIRDLHVEDLGTSSALNKIIVNTNLDLSNNNLITDNIITSINGLNIYTEGTGQNEPSLFLYKNIIGAIEHGGAKERLFIDAEDVFIGNDSLVKKDLICKDLSCENLTLTDINLTGDIRGGSILNIDPAAHEDETGLVVIKGNLQVDGSSTIINSSIVDISDIAILLAANAPNLSATDGAGIDISGGASFKYRYSSGAFDTGHWESNIDLSCDLINTQNIHSDGNLFISAPIFVVQNSSTNFVQLNHQNLGTNNITGIRNDITSINGGIHLDAFGTAQHESGIRIKNRGVSTNHSDTIFNQYNTGKNHIRGSENHINSFTSGLYLNALGSGLNSTIKMNAEGKGTNSGVQIVNGAGGTGSTYFNYDNSGQNYIRGTKLDVVVPEIILTAEKTIGVNDGFINLWAQGTGTNSGVQIRNGVGNNTIFNYQNSASNFIHGTSRFFNDIHIQRLIDASNSTGNFGAVLMSEGTGTNKWSNNPSLPNYLYMGGGGLNVGVSGQVLVSQHPLGFPTWIDAPAYNDTTKTLTITGNATYYGGNSVSLAGGNFGINFFSGINISSSNALFFDHIVGTFSPTSVRDGVYSLGSSPRRWSTVYATNGTINTSDDRLKINEKPITGALKLINNLEYYEYDKVKTLDGTDITHKERGVIAQQLINTDISFILSGGKIETIEDPIATTETKYIPYGVKYNDLFVTLCSAVKELSQLNKSLEARLLALESK
jgi:hypothetical protein